MLITPPCNIYNGKTVSFCHLEALLDAYIWKWDGTCDLQNLHGDNYCFSHYLGSSSIG